jgi:hypothetical protein
MGITREMSKILSTSTAITTDAEISAYNYLSQSTASATYLNQTSYQPGLVLLTPTSAVNGTVSSSGTVTFSGASTVSLNDVFSSTYDRYKIVINQSGTSVTSGQLQMRLRVSGVDNSNAEYRSEYMGGDSTTVYAGRSSGLTFWFIGRILNDHRTWCELDIINPFTSSFRPTTWNNYNDIIAGNINMVTTTGALDVTTSYTGFTVIAESGSISGSISVYGYRD